MIDLNLTGRRAVVTGASLGIGAATVRTLADHGAQVSFCARNEAAVEALDGYEPPDGEGSVAGRAADMADRAAVDAFFEKVLGGGAVDILVNNVGASPSRNFLYMSDDDWEELFRLNLLSAVRSTRHCLPGMRQQKWGRVVMVASAAAKYPGAALIDYGASKAAMVATGKALVRQVRPRQRALQFGSSRPHPHRHVGAGGEGDRERPRRPTGKTSFAAMVGVCRSGATGPRKRWPA